MLFRSDEGPQIVTRHGEEVAVVIDIAEYRHLKGEVMDFKDYLRSGRTFDDINFSRNSDLPRETSSTRSFAPKAAHASPAPAPTTSQAAGTERLATAETA